MKRVIFFIAFLGSFISGPLNAATVVLDDKADFESAIVSSTDTETSEFGLRIRSYDTPEDFVNHRDYLQIASEWADPREHSISTDVPVGSGYTQSRKHVSSDAGDGKYTGQAGYCTGETMFFGLDSALIQPLSTTWYRKAPYHDSGLPGHETYYYVFADIMMFPILNHHDKLFTSNHLGPCLSLDTHTPYGVGKLNIWSNWGYLDNSACGEGTINWRVTWNIPKTTWGESQINNQWIKYKFEYDWTNKKYRLFINDTLQTSMSKSDCYAPETITDGWVYITNLNPDGPLISTVHSDRISVFTDRLDSSLTRLPDFGPITSYSCTNYNKWRIKSASATLQIPTDTLSSNIASANLLWTTTDVTDETLNFLASRSYANPEECEVSASTSATNHPASDAIAYTGKYHEFKDDTKYWQSTSTSAWYRVDFGSTPRVISWTEIEPYWDGIEEFANRTHYSQVFTDKMTINGITVKASQDASNWTTLYTGTYDMTYFFNDITFVNTTAYRYYQFEFTHPTLNPGLWTIKLRDGNTRAASAWTQKTVECRTSSNGGISYGPWHTLNSGDSIPDVSFPISSSDLRVQARVTLNTDAQKYQPVLTSLTLSDEPISDSSPPVSSGWNPAKSATGVSRNANIVVHVTDSGIGVNQSSIVMTVEGNVVTPSITGTPADYTLTYTPGSPFGYGQEVDVTVDASDLASTPNVMTQDAWSFTVESAPSLVTRKIGGNPPR